MRVLIDARSIGSQMSGVSRHALNLLLGLSHIESDLEFVVLYHSIKAPKMIERSGGQFRSRFHWVRSRIDSSSLWSKYWLRLEVPLLLRTHRIRLFHDLSNLGAWTLNIPFVTTVHELEKLRPEVYSEKSIEKYRQELRKNLKGVRLIIAVSNTVAHEIDNRLHFSMPQIRVIPNAIDPWYFEQSSHEEIKAMRERFGLHKAYYLCVTSKLNASKNSDFVVKFAEENRRKEDFVFTLPASLKQGKAERVVYLNSVEDVWLRPLYAESSAVVTPSHYEGFSLPPLESLASGTIPVVSNIAAHRETLSEIVPESLFFDPNDADSLMKSLESLQNGGEPLRNAVLEKFKLVKDRYSFIETAKRVHAIYHEALGR